MGTKWLICFLSDNDQIVERRVSRNGYDTFCPRYVNGKPLFPGYLFAKLEQHWPVLNTIDGVVRVLGGEEPHLAPKGYVESLQKKCPLELYKPADPSFGAGDIVTITAGPHTGLIGTVHGKKRRRGRLAIELDYLGGRRVVSIPIHLLASPSAAFTAS